LTNNGKSAVRQPAATLIRPHWDGWRLWWGDEVVKEFGRAAPGQMAVLGEFERLGWPLQIDLRHLRPAGCARSHWARDTARNLNHGLRRLRFHADGTKHGLYWVGLAIAIYSKLLHDWSLTLMIQTV
jgi:hypothetical protein